MLNSPPDQLNQPAQELATVRREQVRLSFSGTPLSMVTTIINACLLYYLLVPVIPENNALTWLAVISMISLARLLLYFGYRATRADSISIRTWSHLFTIGSFAAGCAWGATSLYLFPADSIAHQVFIAFIIAGMTAGAVATLSYNWIYTVAFIVPALLPLTVRYLLLDTPIATAMGIMVTLYFIILLSSTRKFYQNNLQNILLRNETRQREHDLQQFKSTLDQTLDCVFMFSADDLRFCYVNQGAMDQVGYSQQELLCMKPFDIKPEFSEERFRDMLQPLYAGQLATIRFETVHQHKDGHTIPVEVFIQYIAPNDGPARFVAIVRDITERKRLDKIKDEFVSTVSHELRTPLTSLRGSLGLVLGGAVGDLNQKQHELLDIAQNNTERLLLLINDILDIEKIESGATDYHFRTVELTELVVRSLQENQAYADKYHVHFRFTPPDYSCPVYADPDRIIQVMSNLLSNAAKFSPLQTEIQIVIERRNASFRVSVTDQGSGIPPEFEDKVFEKFTQSDATDQRQHGGTGLGLTISKSIIEKHHGQIGFTTQVGLGSSFYFDLPVAAE